LSIVKTLHAENDHFIGIFGDAHLPSLHDKLHKDTHNYFYIGGGLTKEEAQEKESEMEESLRERFQYTEEVVGKDCVERVSHYVNPFGFTNYWESENVFLSVY